MDAALTNLVYIAIGAGALSLIVAFLIARIRVLSKDPGTPEMIHIMEAVQEGAKPFPWW